MVNTETFTFEEYNDLKKAYETAVAEGKLAFMFKTHNLPTAFAKHLIAYVGDKFKTLHDGKHGRRPD